MWNDESVFDKETEVYKFRNYEDACDKVKAFYKEHHGQHPCLQWHAMSLTPLFLSTEKQTMAFNTEARMNFEHRKRTRMSVWKAIELLNSLIDESDPDVSRFFKSNNPTDCFY